MKHKLLNDLIYFNVLYWCYDNGNGRDYWGETYKIDYQYTLYVQVPRIFYFRKYSLVVFYNHTLYFIGIYGGVRDIL